MRLYSITILITLAMSSGLVAQHLEVLETYYPDSWYELTDWYPEFDLEVSQTGDILGLYALLSSGEASYILRQYPQNEPAIRYSIGGYWGNGGSYYPKLCGYHAGRFTIQISGFGDIVEPYQPHELHLLDLTENNENSRQYFYTQRAQLGRFWKTDSSFGSLFLRQLGFGEGDTLSFIKQVDLFDDWQNQIDSNFVVQGDTLLQIPSVSSFYPQRMGSEDVFFALYEISGSDTWSAVCVSLDSIVTQIDSLFPKGTTAPQLDTLGDEFTTILKHPSEEVIHLYTLNPSTSEASSIPIYESPSLSLEYLDRHQSTILQNEIVLQIPVLVDGSSNGISNWYALIQKRVSRNDYSIISTDTIFIFEPQTDIIRHKITDDGENTHSLIATRTPGRSRIYYYGRNDLVSIASNQLAVPSKLSLMNAYPNPFNSQITISWSLPVGVKGADLQIFDLKGRMVWYKSNIQEFEVAWHGIDQNGKELESGVYLLSVSAGGDKLSQKMLMLK